VLCEVSPELVQRRLPRLWRLLLLDQPGRERRLRPKLRRLSQQRDVLRRTTLSARLSVACFS